MAEPKNQTPEVESETKKEVGEDKELDDLLDSALEDLIKPPVKAETTTEDESTTAVVNPTEEMGGVSLGDMSDQWTEEIKNLAVNYESTMEALLGQMMAASQSSGEGANNITFPNQEDINASIQKLAEATTQVLAKTETNSNNDEITATIFETLKNLSTGTQNAQNMEVNDESFANMFTSLGLEGANLPGLGGGDGVGIQDMMQWLISKDVLYPSLKEITDKYPQWLDDNKSNLDEATFERYTKQNDLMKSVCSELESENDQDSSEVKSERTNRVLKLMLQLEYFGEPPADLVGNQSMNAQMALGAAGQPGACCLQ